MAVNSKVCLILLLLYYQVKSSVLPVEKCNLEDSSCMIPAIQKAVPIFVAGLPELGTEVLDVMEMYDVVFDLAGFQFSLKGGQLKGLKNSIIDNVKWDLKKKRVALHYHVDCIVKGHYTASGQILILPITGDGEMKLKLKNLDVKLYISYEMEKNADGNDYVVPNKYDFDFEVKDNAHFSLTNLFNGNKDLSDTMLTFLNENWKQISVEFGKPLMEAAAKKLFVNVARFFSKIPIKDIALV